MIELDWSEKYQRLYSFTIKCNAYFFIIRVSETV